MGEPCASLLPCHFAQQLAAVRRVELTRECGRYGDVEGGERPLLRESTGAQELLELGLWPQRLRV